MPSRDAPGQTISGKTMRRLGSFWLEEGPGTKLASLLPPCEDPLQLSGARAPEHLWQQPGNGKVLLAVLLSEDGGFQPSMALAYKVVSLPHLGMSLEIGAVYTTAELELRCGGTKARQRQLAKKLENGKVFKPTSTFPFTSISLNINYRAKRHRDKNNSGPSAIAAVGPFQGGELLYWPRDDKSSKVETLQKKDAKVLNIKKKMHFFDGTCAHEVRPFRGGERFSLVYFTVSSFCSASKAVRRAWARATGERDVPTAQSLQKAMARSFDERSIHQEAKESPFEIYSDVRTTKVWETHGDQLDPSINEWYLWHGTSSSAALNICQSDFKMRLAGSATGTLYGRGSYFAESVTKADEYSKEEDGLYTVLLCRVLGGRTSPLFFHIDHTSYNCCLGRTPDPDALTRECTQGESDCILGDRIKISGTYREFIVFDTELVYPEYIIKYKRGELFKRTERGFREAFASNPASVLDVLQEEREIHCTVVFKQKQWAATVDNSGYTLVDLPGRRRFLRNAVAGLAQADGAVLLVPADEMFPWSICKANGYGGQPEGGSRQHSRLLHLLGVTQLCVLVNKMELVPVPEQPKRTLKPGDRVAFLGHQGLVQWDFGRSGSLVLGIQMYRRWLESAQAGDVVGLCVSNAFFPSPERGQVVMKVSEMPAPLMLFQAQVGLTGPLPIRLGNVSLACGKCSRAPCRLVEILWKMNKQTGGQKVEKPQELRPHDMALCTFQPLRPFFCDTYTSPCSKLSRVAFLESNFVMMVGKVVTCVRRDEYNDKAAPPHQCPSLTLVPERRDRRLRDVCATVQTSALGHSAVSGGVVKEVTCGGAQRSDVDGSKEVGAWPLMGDAIFIPWVDQVVRPEMAMSACEGYAAAGPRLGVVRVQVSLMDQEGRCCAATHAGARMTTIEVNNLSGPLCTISVDPKGTIADLKVALAKVLGIPKRQQRLISGMSALSDSQSVSDVVDHTVTFMRITYSALARSWMGQVRRRSALLASAPLDTWHDHEVVLTAMQGDAWRDKEAIRWAADELLNDRDFAQAVASRYGQALRHLPSWQGDPAVVLAAVRQNASAICLASPGLVEQFDFLAEAIKCSKGHALRHLGRNFQEDPRLQKAAVASNWLMLDVLAQDMPSLRDDREVVFAAVSCHGCALEFASKTLRQDPSLVLLALQRSNGAALRWADEHLRGERELVWTAVQADASNLQYASEDNVDLVMEAVRSNGNVLKYAALDLQRDASVRRVAVQQAGGHVLQSLCCGELLDASDLDAIDIFAEPC
eukprot:g27397.t1